MRILLIAFILVAGCSQKKGIPPENLLSPLLISPYLETVDRVNLASYTGTWYEIASFPQFFSENCYCTQADYSGIDAQTIGVRNSCRTGSTTGSVSEITGRAYVDPGSNGARLAVEFFPGFRAPYYILAVDETSYSLVGDPRRASLFVLSRARTMTAERYAALVERARVLGFNVNALRTVNQTCI